MKHYRTSCVRKIIKVGTMIRSVAPSHVLMIVLVGNDSLFHQGTCSILTSPGDYS